jgi:hypothetical protein
MRKRRPDLPWSDIESADELRSIFAALERSPRQLSARLRDGLASKVEQALAADLLEGKIKPKRPRPGSHREARLTVAFLIFLLETLWNVPNLEKAYAATFPGVPPPKLRKLQRKALLHWARETVGHKSKVMKDRAAYNALIEFDDAAIFQLIKPLTQMVHLNFKIDNAVDARVVQLIPPDDGDEQDEPPDPDV